MFYRFKNSLINKMHFFLKKDQGAIAIMFAFFLVPFIAITAISIEVGRLIYVETKLAYAVDAAAIAASKYDVEDIEVNAEKFFYANFPLGFMGMNVTPNVDVSDDGTIVTVTAKHDMETIIGKYLGVETLNANAQAQSLRTFVGVEVAMVLDTTGSMLSGDKIGALKSAAKNFLKVLFQNKNTRPNTSVAIIPYAMTVNVGSNKTSWLIDPETVSDPSKFSKHHPWKGCVKVRYNGVGPFDDSPPSAQKFETYFTESTYPYHNSWEQWDNDWYYRSNGSLHVVNSFSYANIGPNLNCVDPIVPLTNDRGSLNSSINKLGVYMGGTDGSRIIWGWRMLSPRWKGLWGGEPIKEYNAPNNIKAIVMMTDGVNEVPSRNYVTAAITGYETRSNPAVIGNNRLSTGRIYGATSRSAATIAVNGAMAQMCTAIKEKGIEIYTVVLQVNDATTQALYRNCASSPEHTYEPNNLNDLYDDFEKIAKSLNRIRVVK